MDGFEWDEDKRARNLAERGVDFRLAAGIFRSLVLEAKDERTDYGEIRYRAIGRVGEEHFVVIYTWRGGSRRIISAWRVGKVAKEDIRRYSLAENEEMVARRDYVPTRPDAPEYEPDEEFWRNARIVAPPRKASVHLRVDEDVLAWFKAQGPRHLTRMNAVLRAYMEAHRK